MSTRQIATITVLEDVQAAGSILYAGTYRVEMPADYDPELVTGTDILCDEQVGVVEDGEPDPTPEGRRLYLVHNNGYDTVVMTYGGRIVSEWMVTPQVIADLIDHGDLEDWHIHDFEGLATSLEDYGDVVLYVDADGWHIVDEARAEGRAAFYGVTWPACERCGETIPPEHIAMGWPVEAGDPETGELDQRVCPYCYGEEAFCPQGHVLRGDSGDDECAVCAALRWSVGDRVMAGDDPEDFDVGEVVELDPSASRYPSGAALVAWGWSNETDWTPLEGLETEDADRVREMERRLDEEG